MYPPTLPPSSIPSVAAYQPKRLRRIAPAPSKPLPGFTGFLTLSTTTPTTALTAPSECVAASLPLTSQLTYVTVLSSPSQPPLLTAQEVSKRSTRKRKRGPRNSLLDMTKAECAEGDSMDDKRATDDIRLPDIIQLWDECCLPKPKCPKTPETDAHGSDGGTE
ncbi:unnamed protein product [Phytophthora lilii]|uniref:Unnamed protein product n=1 Tax=Phytophthora lilii TaxID=2077276 RepID=A0A9W6U5L2_9STRA|nr:unnamed protein product [Phytophthora lilii]